MAECLLSDPKMDCKNCYKCIRHCPVKSIRFSSGKAQIIDTECILCGSCYQVCPQNVKIIRSDLDKAKTIINRGDPVYASIAPSFVANYPGATIASMRKALKALDLPTRRKPLSEPKSSKHIMTMPSIPKRLMS